MPALNAARRAALPPSDVPPHADAIRQLLQGAACPQPHNATPHAAANVASPVKSAAPRAAVRCAGQACRICCRGGRGGSPRAGGWLPLLVSFTACLKSGRLFLAGRPSNAFKKKNIVTSPGHACPHILFYQVFLEVVS
eukprot:scaffold83485_cov63-Phaeocystis_antarctica.AAC.1